MNLLEVVIISDRLKLVPISINYANDIFTSFTDDVAIYMYPQPSGDYENTKRFIAASIIGLEEGNNLQLVILSQATHEFLGCAGLHNIDRTTPELGIWLKKEAHGNGYGFEAIEAIVSWAQSNIEYEYLKYPVDRRNYASKLIPERLGGEVYKEYKEKNSIGKDLELVEYRLYS